MDFWVISGTSCVNKHLINSLFSPLFASYCSSWAPFYLRHILPSSLRLIVWTFCIENTVKTNVQLSKQFRIVFSVVMLLVAGRWYGKCGGIKILSNVWKPGKKRKRDDSDEYQKEYDKKREQTFQESWREGRPWLQHQNGLLFCNYCVEHGGVGNICNWVWTFKMDSITYCSIHSQNPIWNLSPLLLLEVSQ